MVESIAELKKENCRLQEENTEKDNLLKELSGKNLDLLARFSIIETGLKPLNEDLKKQISTLKEECDSLRKEC